MVRLPKMSQLSATMVKYW